MSGTPTSATGMDSGQFKVLLKDLETDERKTVMRLQLKGKSWMDPNLLVFNKRYVLLTHMPARTVINIPAVGEVTGFEIDRGLGPLKPFLPDAISTSLHPVNVHPLNV